MSYVVELTNIRPTWFVNAWIDSFKKGLKSDRLRYVEKYLRGEKIDVAYDWNHAYPDCVYKDDYFGETVTFPDEQSYAWFVLRWS